MREVFLWAVLAFTSSVSVGGAVQAPREEPCSPSKASLKSVVANPVGCLVPESRIVRHPGQVLVVPAYPGDGLQIGHEMWSFVWVPGDDNRCEERVALHPRREVCDATPTPRSCHAATDTGAFFSVPRLW